MIELKNEKIAIPVVLLAGLIWSFGPLVVRYMDQPNLVPWQYIFARGLTIFLILNLYLFFEEGKDFYNLFFKNWGFHYYPLPRHGIYLSISFLKVTSNNNPSIPIIKIVIQITSY